MHSQECEAKIGSWVCGSGQPRPVAVQPGGVQGDLQQLSSRFCKAELITKVLLHVQSES